MSFFEGLTLLFVALKLLEQLDWSWFVVVSPFMLGLLVTLLARFPAGVMVLGVGTAAALGYWITGLSLGW